MGRTSPLRKVTQRNRDRSERLECGHGHPGSYRAARRRRCHICFIAQATTYRTTREAREAAWRIAIDRPNPAPVQVVVTPTAAIVIPPPPQEQELRDRAAMAPEPEEIPEEDLTQSAAETAPPEASTGPRCVYCLDHEGELVACGGCRTLTHADCREALRRCPTIGCQVRTVGVAATAPPARIVIQGRNKPASALRRLWRAFLELPAVSLLVLVLGLSMIWVVLALIMFGGAQ